MTTTKWLMAAVAVGVLLLLVVVFMVLDEVPPQNQHLPVYQLEQVDSTHAWYRRTTVRLGSVVYVEDFEEYALLLANVDPTNGIGRPSFGNSLMCSIPGESPSNYVAVDCGSEMPAYEVFRNVEHPPFDWRHATFRSMEFSGIIGRTEHKRSTDGGLMAEVVRTLSEGTPTTLALPRAEIGSNMCSVCFVSDELPGIEFCPRVYRDESGAVYLSESAGVEYVDRAVRYHARWIPAGALFTGWVERP